MWYVCDVCLRAGLTGFAILRELSHLGATVPNRSLRERDLLTVGEAASLLGVSVSTLRNWDRNKKFCARRHPINGYRLYSRYELEALLRRIRGTGLSRDAR